MVSFSTARIDNFLFRLYSVYALVSVEKKIIQPKCLPYGTSNFLGRCMAHH